MCEGVYNEFITLMECNTICFFPSYVTTQQRGFVDHPMHIFMGYASFFSLMAQILSQCDRETLLLKKSAAPHDVSSVRVLGGAQRNADDASNPITTFLILVFLFTPLHFFYRQLHTCYVVRYAQSIISVGYWKLFLRGLGFVARYDLSPFSMIRIEFVRIWKSPTYMDTPPLQCFKCIFQWF